MLVLTRRVGESIIIGDNIVVTVIDAGRDHVRIGIDAPRQVAVHRQEVYAAISQENEAASASHGSGATIVGKGGLGAAASMQRKPRRPKP